MWVDFEIDAELLTLSRLTRTFKALCLIIVYGTRFIEYFWSKIIITFAQQHGIIVVYVFCVSVSVKREKFENQRC